MRLLARLAVRAVAVTAIVVPHAAGSMQLPAGPAASVSVRFAAAKSTFQIGEEIALELEFRGQADKDYYFSTAGYDRSGRLDTETYDVTPKEGLDDPLADYFASGVFMGGGLRSSHPLDGTPFVLRVSLNDWVRFSRPGSYRLAVRSGRMERHSGRPAFAITSTPIDLTIAQADPAWAASEAARAVANIDRGSATDVKRGVTLLRYLGTEAAADALIARADAISAANPWDLSAALLSSPHRARLVAAMEARVGDGRSLPAVYIPTLAKLKVLLQMPVVSGDFAARSARTKKMQAEYDAGWRAAVARLPPSASTLGSGMARFSFATPELRQQFADDFARHPEEARQAFLAQPNQWVLLEYYWQYFNRPWILPALREAFAGSHGDSRSAQAGSIALKRLFQVVPDEGRRLILEEIRTGEHGIGYATLAMLPDATLPELDAPLAARLRVPLADPVRDRENHALAGWLAVRYGSTALRPVMEGGRADCRDGARLAFALKNDPEVGQRMLDTCSVVWFHEVAWYYWDDRLEASATARLSSSNVDQAVEAAQTLEAHGSARVKPALMARLVTWNAEWRGRSAELDALRSGAGRSPEGIENFVVNALFQNTRFTITADEAVIVRNLCVTDRCRQNVDSFMRMKGIK